MAASAAALRSRSFSQAFNHSVVASKQTSGTSQFWLPKRSCCPQIWQPVGTAPLLNIQTSALRVSFESSRKAAAFQNKVNQTGCLPPGKNSRKRDGVVVKAGQTNQAQETSSVPDTLSVQNGSVSDILAGEDSGVFDVTAQKTSSWVNFTIVLVVVLAILYVIWIDPTTGFGGKYVDALEGALGGSHEATIIALLSIFALVHSGGAALRASAEKVIGERAYRVLFAGLSLPLAVSSVVYFINHRYDGTQLWQLRTVPGAHELVWIVSFVSFFFLYPSTFNLLEVAAVDKPKLHMWETGIMRITRHPQMTGQLLWCLAHTLWIGNSFTLVTSLGLCAHHLFGVWHGDRRLETKYGEAFQAVKGRTSIVPFQAIIEGRQKLPQDWYKEYLRVPYFVIVGVTLGAYFSHPLMQQGSFWLHW